MYKNVKLKKSKFAMFNLAFWILLVCSILMIGCIIRKNFCVFNIKNIGSTVKPITLNVLFNSKVNDAVFVCFDDYCKPIENNSLLDNALNLTNSYSASFDNSDEQFIAKKVKSIKFAYPAKAKNFEYKIDNISLHIGDKLKTYTFEEVQKLDSKTVSLLLEGKEEKVEYKVVQFEKSNNNYGFFHCFGVILLSFVFNWQFYIVPYAWLFVALLIFLFNKDVFEIKLKTKGMFLGILSLFYLILFVCFFAFMPRLENGKNDLINFVLFDSKNYKDYEIHIISDKKEIPEQLKENNIVWHFVDVEKDGEIKKIEREKYIPKNKRGILYFNSDVANVEMMSMSNKKLQVFKTNYKQNGKMVFYKEQ